MSRYDAFLDDGGNPSDWERISHAENGPAMKAVIAMLDGEKKPNPLALGYMARIAAAECGIKADKKDEKE